MIATTPAEILRFAAARIDEGRGTVLVTLTHVEGSSPRAIGAQMAVADDGRYAGSFSGGCIEAAVVAEAIGTLADGRAKLVRFGAGSPYLDIRLPCGSGIDLLFNPHPDPTALARVLAQHDRREPATLRLSHEGVSVDDAMASGWKGDGFNIRYLPGLRLLAMGQGEELTALARLAAGFGAEVCAVSPDRGALAGLAAEGIDIVEWIARTHLPSFASDPWTAFVSVFHDRDWEEELLPRALDLPGFYVGAIGSPRTQEIRRDALRSAGTPDHLVRRLRATVGLIPAARDPATLALSILSEIVQEYHALLPDSRDLEPSAADIDQMI
ncbi:XdhC family protein [Sphingopyxis macrogoltabida]|uniref:Xanthine dehydrogenase n=1 Tax=Sphingopyxis macrogoltabida TaxID=33050 RepID=A0AAC9AW62_SPHMC|nr:XdhC family protein [Sphingopyxis macrogoltabida]ALJ14746.1 acyl-CoA thioester hydrolase [Sphingopyxis macrogoltabida]AMU91002.1 xanthine dehydrogenase [Sphingopyxis macrogoltabida]